MKKALAGAMLLVFLLGCVPLSLGMAHTSHNPAHHCCPRVQAQFLLQLPPASQPCGPQHRCCMVSQHPATLQANSPTPLDDLAAAPSPHPGELPACKRADLAFEPLTLLFRSQLRMILRV